MGGSARKVVAKTKQITVQRKGGKLTAEEKTRRNKMKVRLLDLMMEAHRLNKLEDPRYEELGSPMIELGFVENAEDAMYNTQHNNLQKTSGIRFLMCKMSKVDGMPKLERYEESVAYVLNVESSENTWEFVVEIFKELEMAILEDLNEKARKETVKNKAVKLLTADERKLIGLHF
jgi:hypothetical protein